MNNLSRKKIQELSAISLFVILTYVHMQDEVDVQKILSDVFNCSYEEVPPFAKEIVISFLKHSTEEVRLIESHMHNWTFDRLDRMEQAILLLSVTNFFYREEKVDKAVVISVAVSLAHLYLDSNRYKFVNAILDNILK